MIEPGGGRLNPLQAAALDRFVPRDRDFRVAALDVRLGQFRCNAILAGVDQLGFRPDALNASDVLGFDGVAEDNSHHVYCQARLARPFLVQ